MFSMKENEMFNLLNALQVPTVMWMKKTFKMRCQLMSITSNLFEDLMIIHIVPFVVHNFLHLLKFLVRLKHIKFINLRVINHLINMLLKLVKEIFPNAALYPCCEAKRKLCDLGLEYDP